MNTPVLFGHAGNQKARDKIWYRINARNLQKNTPTLAHEIQIIAHKSMTPWMIDMHDSLLMKYDLKLPKIIASFTVAWHRPDMFGKVHSSNWKVRVDWVRPKEEPIKLGGQDYPVLISTEALIPIRIFVQDGINNLINQWADWFLAN